MNYTELHIEHLKGVTLRSLSKKYKVHADTISVNFKKLGFPVIQGKSDDYYKSIYSMYAESEITLKKYCNLHNLNYVVISRKFKNLKFKLIPVSRKRSLNCNDCNKIKLLLEDQYKSLQYCADLFNVSKQCIRRSFIFHRIDYKFLKNNSKLIHNPTFFKQITTEIQSYLLGLLYSDGCVRENGSITLSLQESDFYNVNLFKTFIGGTIRKDPKRKINHKDQYRWFCSSKLMVNDLIKLGCVENKSHTGMQFPNIPEELNRHFIRGFFDGDGSIYKSIRNIKIKFFCTDRKFLEKIAEAINTSNYYWDKNNTVHVLIYGNYENRTHIKNYFYSNANFAMKRKFDKFNMYVNTVLNDESKNSSSV